MVFSAEDKILIKELRETKRHGARRLITEFPMKNWSLAGVSKLLKTIATTGSVARKPRDRALRTQININAVEELVLSQDNQPCTHLSNRETARAIGMSKSSVHNTVKKLSCEKHILRTGVL